MIVPHPFKIGKHITIVYEIAEGLSQANTLNNYLEIGISKGECFNKIAPLIKNQAFGVDVDEKSYLKIKHNSNLKWFCGKSDLFFETHKEQMFDLIFIDGDHSHEQSLKDFNNSLNVLKIGGIILMHDTYPPTSRYLQKKFCADSYKTAIFIKENFKNCECLTLPFYYGITIIRKIEGKHLLWL